MTMFPFLPLWQHVAPLRKSVSAGLVKLPQYSHFLEISVRDCPPLVSEEFESDADLGSEVERLM